MADRIRSKLRNEHPTNKRQLKDILRALTVDQLKGHCRDLGVRGYSVERKERLVDLLVQYWEQQGGHNISDAKLFEAECSKTLSRMRGGMTVLGQGTCIQCTHHCCQRACPDIFGFRENGKGFAIDCKLYSGQRQISGNDVTKLQRDVREVKQELRNLGHIGPREEVVGIFVSTVNKIVRDHGSLHLITINYDGGLGDRWEAELQRKIRDVL